MKQELLDVVMKSNPDYWGERFLLMKKHEHRDTPIRYFKAGVKYQILEKKRNFVLRHQRHYRYLGLTMKNMIHEPSDPVEVPKLLHKCLYGLGRGMLLRQIGEEIGKCESRVSRMLQEERAFQKEKSRRA